MGKTVKCGKYPKVKEPCVWALGSQKRFHRDAKLANIHKVTTNCILLEKVHLHLYGQNNVHCPFLQLIS